MPKQEPADPESFEAALEQLEEVTKQLESSELPLEKALALFEKGMALSERCRNQLLQAEARVETLIAKRGEMVPKPFEPESE